MNTYRVYSGARPSCCVRWARRGKNWLLATLAAFTLAATAGSAAELLVNGNLDSGLYPWKTSPEHGPWDPLAYVAGEMNLHPDRPGQRGDVVYQNLNVTGIAGVTVTAGLQMRMNYLPDGRSFGVYLEYLDTAGLRHRVRVLQPDNGAIGSIFSTFSDTYTFPGDAARLVKFSVAKEGDGTAYADGLSLTGDGVTVLAVPSVSHLDPACGPHSTVVGIHGSHFGTAAGTVRFAGVPGTVQSWTDTLITARIEAPAPGGRVTLWDANQVENHGMSPFHVTSPFLTGNAVRAHQKVIRGDLAEFVVNVEFHNGFMSASGMELSVPALGAAATFSPGPIKESGGGLVKVDTSGLAPGIHPLTIRAGDGVQPGMDFPVVLEVVTITNIEFTTRDPITFATMPVANPLVVTAQGDLLLGANFTDNTGAVIGEFDVDYEAMSSDPGVVMLYEDNFGRHAVAVGNGTAVITLTSPDGYSSNLTVNVAFPASGSLTTMTLGLPAMDNAGTFTNTFNVAADVALASIGYANVISNVSSVWFNNNQAYQSEFIVHPGSAPGVYAFSAETADAKSVALLTVTNAAERGEMKGEVHMLNGQFIHGLIGQLKFHNAASGALVFERPLELGFAGGEYTLSFLPPGDYKVLLAVDPFLPFEPMQWFPNARAMAGAIQVTVPAGGSVEGIDFFLAPPLSLPLPEAVEFCPGDLFSGGHNNAMWAGQQLVSQDGQDAARSPLLGDDQSSFMEATVTGPGTLTFWWKVSSEANADRLIFELNFNEHASISGETDWAQMSVPVPAGPTTVSWSYVKNATGTGGMDAGWVDAINFAAGTAPSPPVIDTQPVSQTVGLNGNAQLSVAVSGDGPFSYQWRFNGVAITGANGMMLDLTQLMTADAGRYTVTVTGPGGSVTSAAATLTLIDLHMYAGVTIIGRVGDRYRIDYANSLNAPTWTSAETITLPASPYRWFDIDSPNHTMRYYRAILLQP